MRFVCKLPAPAFSLFVFLLPFVGIYQLTMPYVFRLQKMKTGRIPLSPFIVVLLLLATPALVRAGCTSCKAGYDFINEESYYSYSVSMTASQCRSACNNDPNCYGYTIAGSSRNNTFKTCSLFSSASNRAPHHIPYSVVCAGICS